MCAWQGVRGGGGGGGDVKWVERKEGGSGKNGV